MNPNKYFFVLIAVFFVFYACSKKDEEEKEHLNGTIITDATLAQELSSVPETLSIAYNNYHLETYLWRDFMPVSEEDGRPLACVDKLIETQGLTISQNIELKKQYVINGNKIWIADFSGIRTPNDHVIEGLVNNGPKWEPGIYVDVVIEFEADGTTYRLSAKNQIIERTN